MYDGFDMNLIYSNMKVYKISGKEIDRAIIVCVFGIWSVWWFYLHFLLRVCFSIGTATL